MEYIKILKEYIDTFLNFIYPRNIYCIICNSSIEREEEYSICDECKDKLKFIWEKTCDKCGKPLDELYLADRCPECIDNSHYYTKAVSCIEYDDSAKKTIYDLKYHKKRYIAYHVAEIIYDRLIESDIHDFDIIIPVPLHKARQRERSFNQAGIISKYIGKMMNIDVDNRSLIRCRNTITQNQLTKEERRKNLEDAFEIINNNNIRDKNVLLIDDIYTTGSTVNQCSKVLTESGALNVYVATFATGRNYY
ncbi:ComF family protein [Wukongibacter baidiensis]|uniref:ComF family protein n=1 Tax=Wukongibacter baidiensis TaxID=1723361 RepID=UPI003D7FF00C